MQTATLHQIIPACPFCDSAQLVTVRDRDRLSHVQYSVMCFECGAKGPLAPTEVDARTRWSEQATE